MGAGKSHNCDQAFFNKYTTQKYYINRGASGNVYGPIQSNDMQLAIIQVTFAIGIDTEEFKKDTNAKKEIWTSLEHKNSRSRIKSTSKGNVHCNGIRCWRIFTCNFKIIGS